MRQDTAFPCLSGYSVSMCVRIQRFHVRQDTAMTYSSGYSDDMCAAAGGFNN